MTDKRIALPDISGLSVPAEQYHAESCFSDFPKDSQVSLMHEAERRFVHGLINFIKPERILEIGVAYGGGTAVLLNAIKFFKDSEVISIDLAKVIQYGSGNVKNTGHFAKKHFKNNKNWKLFVGKDPSEIIEKLIEDGGGKPFDFCVIDTAHIHPVESLNFLTIFPFLSDNAVVVIHDLIEFTGVGKGYPQQISQSTRFANKLLFDCLCGPKLKVKDETYLSPDRFSGNIGAIQITKDTKKYIQNVFSMLMFPWGLLPSLKHLKLISGIIKKYYDEENFKEFCHAVRLNLKFISNDFSYKDKNNKNKFRPLKNAKNIIFYGAGLNCKKLLGMLKSAKLKKPSEIWDINPNIKSILGIRVKQPVFISKEEYKNCVIVITIEDKHIANDVKNELNNCGFSKIYLAHEFYLNIAIEDKSVLGLS